MVDYAYALFIKQLFKRALKYEFFGKVLSEQEFIHKLDKYPELSMFMLGCPFLRDLKQIA